MTNSNLKFKPVVKDRLFYNRFQYAISFYLDEATCLRELDHEFIDRMIERRIRYRDLSQQLSWLNGKQTIISRRWQEITDDTVVHLHSVASTLLDSKSDYKVVTSLNTVWVYTNTKSLIKRLDQLEFLHKKTYTQAVVDRPANTIRLKNPRHTHRSYFKTTKITAEQKNQLENFFVNQQEHIRVSPSLIEWFNCPYLRTQDYFFIDHNGESWLLMLALIHPGLTRKTMELIAG